MSITSLINRTCTIVSRSAGGDVDEYGGEVLTETSTTTVCELQQRRADERELQGESSDDRWIAFLNPDEEIETADILIVDGQKFEVVGDPWVARNPRTRENSHIEVQLRRTAGSEDGS